MPVFEKTTGGEVLLRGVDRRVSVGDRVDAEDGFADYLRGRGDFEVVDDHYEAEFSEVDDEEEQDDGFDVGVFVGRTPVDDVVDDIEAGEADDHLDAVAEEASRVTVEDAVGERRAELAEEE